MQVTDVRVRRVEKEGKMKAIVSITLDNEFVIHDIKVIEGEKGLFIAMPSRKAADGEYRDIAHPINSGTRDMIQSIILNDVYIGDNTVIENCIVESRDTIRANTTHIGTPGNIKIVVEKNERYTL